MLKKILIANRGEIAVRIIRACREMAIPTVAVYSTVDRDALHVQMADEAVAIGPPPPLESYLNIDNLIRAARASGADAIHPGYGFLSENHLFAQHCLEAGLVFIGPNPRALKLVGDKVESRKTVLDQKIPIIPGMQCVGQKLDDFADAAKGVGYPVIIKASLGGGGKGMRVVHNDRELKDAVDAGMREAKSAFGDASVYLEKYIEEPRHVEFQILADQRGHVVHLFERECSIQRRHQKIIEETPSPVMDESLRQEMGATAVSVARAVGYTNAGTVEFLLDRDRRFYFLEVNARIQVEHPITEMVTGVDLVRQQILIASGEPLDLRPEDLRQRGHAIECRVYAEDPDNGFMPSPGKIHFTREPSGPNLRCDSGLYSGIEITPYYDPILAKLIGWGENRELARQRLITALNDYVIIGIKSTVGFLKGVLADPDFAAGRFSTDFVNRYLKKQPPPTPAQPPPRDIILAAAIIGSSGLNARRTSSVKELAPNPWQTLGKWEVGQ